MKKRVGILTSGGDCPGLNATIRGAAKALYQRFGDEVEIVGIQNGYDGLIKGEWREMQQYEFSGILTVGGTILGTKRTPFKMMTVVEDDKVDKVAAMKKTYKDAKLDCLLCLGGNGTHKTANLLSEEGLNIIGPAQDHRQRYLRHRRDLRLPHGCGYCHGSHRPHPYNGLQPPPLHGHRDHGQQSGMADAVFRHRPAARISSSSPSCLTISRMFAPPSRSAASRARRFPSWLWRRVYTMWAKRP